jgi:hypothetical protein
LDLDDVAGDSLTGGYLIKIDKVEGELTAGWTSALKTRYQYDYPKFSDMAQEQIDYIKKYMDDYEAAMSADWTMDQSYLDKIDYDSFVDHFILCEFTKNVDSYRISAFMYKDVDSKGGRLTMGPIWDMHLTMGKAYYPQDVGLFEGWEIDYGITHPEDGFQVPFWWQKLAHDALFQQKASQRWQQLRAAQLQKDRLYGVIDGLAAQIAEARLRHFQKWPSVLKTRTYEDYIQEWKVWIANRLDWIDANITSIASDVRSEKSIVQDFHLLQNYPNPFNPVTTISFTIPAAGRVRLEIFNVAGQKIVTLVDRNLQAGTFHADWNALGLSSGIYFYSLHAGEYSAFRRMVLLQ